MGSSGYRLSPGVSGLCLLSAQFLLFFDFRQGFAVDAKSSGGSGFKALDANFDATGITVAVVILHDSFQGAVYFLDQLALPVPGPKLKTELLPGLPGRQDLENWPPRLSCGKRCG